MVAAISSSVWTADTKAEVPRIMAGVAELRVPLVTEVGVGPNWDKAH